MVLRAGGGDPPGSSVDDLRGGIQPGTQRTVDGRVAGRQEHCLARRQRRGARIKGRHRVLS